jgi:membrane associated rhomboid family serine protease
MAKIKFYFLWLILIIIGFFILQSIIPGFTDLLVLNNKVFQGQFWRVLTSIFLHGDIIHLLYNLFALFFFGLALEKLIGSNRFLLVFLTSGIIANLIAVNFYSSSLGASGAIYGIIGCVTILRPMMMVWGFGIILPLFLAAILWVAADILRIFGLNPSNIGSIAHLSGIVVGLFFGILYRSKMRTRKAREKINLPESYIQIWEDRNMKR